MCLDDSDAPPLLALAAWAQSRGSKALLAWSCPTLPLSLNPTSFWMNTDELQFQEESVFHSWYCLWAAKHTLSFPFLAYDEELLECPMQPFSKDKCDVLFPPWEREQHPTDNSVQSPEHQPAGLWPEETVNDYNPPALLIRSDSCTHLEHILDCWCGNLACLMPSCSAVFSHLCSQFSFGWKFTEQPVFTGTTQFCWQLTEGEHEGRI